MIVCTTFTDTHKVFLENYFLKTFPFEDRVTLVMEKVAQKCKTGSLFSEGWRDQMIEKQLFINRQLQLHKQSEVLFTDVDVSFYGSFRADLMFHLKDKDICFMKDHNSDELGRCGGFFVTRSTDKMKAFFRSVLERLNSYRPDGNVAWETSEQSTINTLLNENKDINWGFLPNKYYTHGLHTHGIKNFSDDNQSGLWWENKSYEEKSGIFVPSDILVHHANWAKGIENKLDVLNWVKDIHAHNSNVNVPRRGG